MHNHAGPLRWYLLQDLPGPIGGTIIDQDQFLVERQTLHLLEEGQQGGLLIVYGYDYRNLDIGLGILIHEAYYDWNVYRCQLNKSGADIESISGL
jgi:hypothetical protein